MNKKIHSLALLVNLGIYGVALPAMADDNAASAQHEDTMVITAAEQNLQAPACRPSPPMRSAKPARAGRGGNHPHHAGR